MVRVTNSVGSVVQTQLRESKSESRAGVASTVSAYGSVEAHVHRGATTTKRVILDLAAKMHGRPSLAGSKLTLSHGFY